MALGRASGAEAVVSGDRDLIEAGLDKPPIWTPAECVRQLRETRRAFGSDLSRRRGW